MKRASTTSGSPSNGAPEQLLAPMFHMFRRYRPPTSNRACVICPREQQREDVPSRMTASRSGRHLRMSSRPGSAFGRASCGLLYATMSVVLEALPDSVFQAGPKLPFRFG